MLCGNHLKESKEKKWPSLSLRKATWRILVEALGAEGGGISPGLGHPPARLVCHYCGLDSVH